MLLTSGRDWMDVQYPDDPVTANLHEWADAVEERGTYSFTANEILHNVTILESIVTSAATRKPVRVRDVAIH